MTEPEICAVERPPRAKCENKRNAKSDYSAAAPLEVASCCAEAGKARWEPVRRFGRGHVDARRAREAQSERFRQARHRLHPAVECVAMGIRGGCPPPARCPRNLVSAQAGSRRCPCKRSGRP